jgi:hypothetical protein
MMICNRHNSETFPPIRGGKMFRRRYAVLRKCFAIVSQLWTFGVAKQGVTRVFRFVSFFCFATLDNEYELT